LLVAGLLPGKGLVADVFQAVNGHSSSFLD
jgi:hypothetical protein